MRNSAVSWPPIWQTGPTNLSGFLFALSGCDFNGQDLHDVLTSSNQGCQQTCRSNPNCTHYTWLGWTPTICYMKTGPRTPSNAVFFKGTCGLDCTKPGIICGTVRK